MFIIVSKSPSLKSYTLLNFVEIALRKLFILDDEPEHIVIAKLSSPFYGLN